MPHHRCRKLHEPSEPIFHMPYEPALHTSLTSRLIDALPGVAVPLPTYLRISGGSPGPDAAHCQLRLVDLERLFAGTDPARYLPELALLSPRRQLSYVGGRLCAERAVLGAVGVLCAIGMDREGVPRWPGGCRGSITHGAELAAAIASPECSHAYVGLDVESIADIDGLEAIARVCLTAREQQSLKRSRRPCDEATLRFSAKESYYKAVYAHFGRWVDYCEAEVTDIDWRAGSFVIQPAGASAVGTLPLLRGSMQMLGSALMTWILA